MFEVALTLVIIGCLITIGIIIARAIVFKSRVIKFDLKYRLLFWGSLIGPIAAAIGSYMLIKTPISSNKEADYSLILTVVSLLATGVITGFFTFRYQNVDSDERVSPTALSCFFAALFYTVFGLISFYLGKSKVTHNLEGVEIWIPAILWMLLSANVIYEFLDYRVKPSDEPKKDEPKK